MSTITVYAFEDESGCEDTYTTMDYQEAVERAQKYHMLLMAYEFEYEDTDYLADYRSEEAKREHPVAGL